MRWQALVNSFAGPYVDLVDNKFPVFVADIPFAAACCCCNQPRSVPPYFGTRRRGAHPKGDITSNGNEYSPNFNEFYQILTNFHELTRIRANLLGLTRIDSDFLRFIQFFSVNFENQFESNPCCSKIRIKGEHEFDSN